MSMDDLYTSRANLAVAFAKAAIAAGWNAGRGLHQGECEVGWENVVYVDLPDGRQVSWHISPQDSFLLAGLPQYNKPWDGSNLSNEMDWALFNIENKIFSEVCYWCEIDRAWFPVTTKGDENG